MKFLSKCFQIIVIKNRKFWIWIVELVQYKYTGLGKSVFDEATYKLECTFYIVWSVSTLWGRNENGEG
jgi:hypothetical protein